MNKSTKRFLSYILTVAMLFTSVFTNAVFVNAEDLTEGGTTTPTSLDEFKDHDEVPTGEAITYSFDAADESDKIALQGTGAEGYYHGVWVDATSGKFASNGVSNGTQINAGTIIYVPVNGKSTIKVGMYSSGNNINVSDSEGYDDAFVITGSNWNKTEYTYLGKDSTVALEITDNNYIKEIIVTSEGVQEGEVKTWEKKDFSFKLNNIKIEVTGAESASGKASVKVGDAAAVDSTNATSAKLEVPLGNKALSNDMITDLSEGIGAVVADGNKILVTFTNNEIKPFEFEFTVEDTEAVWEPNVEIGTEYTYILEGRGAMGELEFSGKAREVNGLWVDTTASGAKFYSTGRTSNGALVNKAVISVPVKGKTDISIATGYNTSNITVTDDKGYNDTFAVAQENWGTDTYTYTGKSESVIYLTLEGSLYIQTITAKSYGVQEGEVKTWEKRDFNFKINGTKVSVVGAESITSSAAISFDDESASVVAADSTSAKIKVNLGGNALSSDMITDLSEGISAEVVGNKVTVTFTGAEIKPLTFTFTVVDNSIVAEPEVGKTYSYPFAAGEVVSSSVYTTSANGVETLVTDDGLMTINGGGKLYYHDGTHGIAMYDGNTFEIKVAGDAVVTFECCTYGSAKTMTAAVKSGDGTITPASNDISGSGNGGTKGEGDKATFSYTGDATTLVFTVGATGEGYLHGISVQNLAAASEDNGKMDVWDFGAAVLDTEKYNNLLDVDTINGWYPAGTTVGAAGSAFNVPTFTVGDLTWSTSKANNRLRTTNKALTRYDEGNSVGSIKGFNCEDLGIAGCIYLNSSAGGGSFSINLLADDVVCVYVKMDNADDFVTFTKAGATEPVATVPASMEGSVVKFIAPEAGNYTISDTNEAGKPRYYRITREHAEYATISGSIDTSAATNISADYQIVIKNTETNKEFVVTPENGSYSIELPTGYTYQYRLNNAKGFRISAGNQIDFTGTATNDLTIVPVTYYQYSGKATGFADGFDMSNVKIYYKPVDAEDVLSYGTEDVVISDGAYSVQLADNITYKLVLEGANDYEIVQGGNVTVDAKQNVEQDIVFKAKDTYDVSGKFVTSDGEAITVNSITLKRISDEYTYTATIADGGYSIKLPNGIYEVTADIGELTYTYLAHVVVSDGAVEKDITFFAPDKEVPYAKDVYVGTGDEGAYATLEEALTAVNNMSPKPTSEEERITIHIAPGTYRAQHILKTPYVSLVNTDPTKEVKLTWYYGIGYKYYSAAKDGYYNKLNATDKYLKNGSDTEKSADVARWGGAFYVQKTATNFYAENIYFENSFNKYVTAEEIADGVSPNFAQSIRVDRTQAGVDVRTKTATERAAALLVEGDKAEIYNCKISSSQDTLYMNPSIHVYYKDCFVEGMTDYIFGDGEVVFEDCTLNFCGYSKGQNSATGGCITATKYDQGGKGYLFNNCTVTGTEEEGIDVGAGQFGRPWGGNATVTFINTVIANKNLITERGYTDMTGKPEDANYAEYNTTLVDGTAFVTTASKKLTDEEASAIKISDWFGDWTPKNYVESDKPIVVETLYGDVNGDGKITAVDAAMALKAAIEADYNLLLGDKAKKAADVDGNEGISVNDASLILQKVLNSDKITLPVQNNTTGE